MIVKFNSEPNKQYIGKVLSVCYMYDPANDRFVKLYHIKALFHNETWVVNEYDVVKVYR